MKKKSLKCALLIIFTMAMVTAGIHGQPFNKERLFNSGLNFGWLNVASQLNMFPNMWHTYARDGAAEYNYAFNPIRRFQPPPATFKGSQDAASYIGSQLRLIPGGVAGQLFNAGIYLARAHILAQHGRRPTWMRREIRSAHYMLRDAGKRLNHQTLRNISIQLQNLFNSVIVGSNVPPRYINILAGLITQVRQAI